jgi:hypothetical protein
MDGEKLQDSKVEKPAAVPLCTLLLLLEQCPS